MDGALGNLERLADIDVLGQISHSLLEATHELYKLISKFSFERSWIEEIEGQTFYRASNTNFSPLSIAGTLSDGARMNIGGSQYSPTINAAFFDNSSLLNKKGGLYFGSDADTALLERYYSILPCLIQIKERFKVDTDNVLYEIRFSEGKTIRLCNYDKAISSLVSDFPEIKDMLDLTKEMNGRWPDIKRPAPCQLLSHWLLSNEGVDGILFQSTVPGGNKNYFIPIKDDKTSGEMFAKPLKIRF